MRTLLLTLALTGCSTDTDSLERLEPTFIEVSGTVEGEDSTDLKYTNASRTLSVSGTTLDRNAEPYDYGGWVEVVVKPGLVKNVSGAMQVEDSWGETHWYVQARGGQVNVTVEVASSFGNTRAWLTAVPDPNDPGSKASMATGVTESFAVPNPTIPELQDVTQLEIDRP